jgi:hypothetical protein
MIALGFGGPGTTSGYCVSNILPLLPFAFVENLFNLENIHQHRVTQGNQAVYNRILGG